MAEVELSRRGLFGRAAYLFPLAVAVPALANMPAGGAAFETAINRYHTTARLIDVAHGDDAVEAACDINRPAFEALIDTPSPDLRAFVRKFEIAAEYYDGDLGGAGPDFAARLITDVRRLAA